MREKRFFALFSLLCLWVLCGPFRPAFAQQSVDVDGMDDNSFLMEQGFTQDVGTVEHIGYVIAYPTSPKDVYFNYIQEWGITPHQDAGFTLPVTLHEQSGDGLGDIFLDYRYQILQNPNFVLLAPRFSLIVPTGSYSKGLGYGTVGFQTNWSFSKYWNRHFATHWNLGTTLLPRAKQVLSNGQTGRKFLANFNFGTSVAWMANKRFNMALEFVSNLGSEINNNRNINLFGQYILNPGMSTSIDIGPITILPGLSIPLTWTRDHFQPGVYFYLSLQHPYRKLKN